MKIIVGSRGSGKTVEAIKESKRSGARIIVMSKRQEKLILDTAKKLGISDLPEPIVLSENNQGSIGKHDKGILENADAYLREIFDFEVETITISSDNVVELRDVSDIENSSKSDIIREYKLNRALGYLESKWNGKVDNDSDEGSEPKLEDVIINDLVNILKEENIIN